VIACDVGKWKSKEAGLYKSAPEDFKSWYPEGSRDRKGFLGGSISALLGGRGESLQVVSDKERESEESPTP
jgi:hypothetical protein